VRAGRRAHHQRADAPGVLGVRSRHGHLRRRRAGDGEHYTGAPRLHPEPIEIAEHIVLDGGVRVTAERVLRAHRISAPLYRNYDRYVGHWTAWSDNGEAPPVQITKENGHWYAQRGLGRKVDLTGFAIPDYETVRCADLPR
jgi:hypothetical protein